MIIKIILIIIYFGALYNFTFLEIVNIYNFNLLEIDFLLFLFFLIISIGGLIFLRFFQIQNIQIKNNLNHTFKSIFFLYLFLIIGFYISQDYLTHNRVMLTAAKLSGNLGFLFLALGLLVSPILTFIQNIKVRDFLTLFRKLFGILVFIIIIRHVIDYFQANYINSILDALVILKRQFAIPIVGTGIVGLIIFILLGLTSNKFSVSIMGSKMWKLLHFLVFPAFLVSMIHIYLLGRMDLFYGGFTVLIILLRIMSSIARRHRRRKSGKVTKYLCPPCGFIYDERLGDPDGGLEPGTVFKDIPHNRYCPVCGAKKSDFVPYYETEDTIFGGILLKVTKRTLVTNNVLHIVLSSKKEIKCLPGQYVGFIMKDFDGEFSRSYSIVSSKNKSIEFYIKLKDTGRAGKLLKKINIGDYFKITGIYGDFVLKETNAPKVFIATGTGLAPMINMIKSNSFSMKTALFFGVAKKDDLFGIEKIKETKNLEMNIFFSQEKVAGYNFGRINLNDRVFSDNTEFYICGSPSMVEDVEKVLKEKGYTSIFSEKFD